MTVHPEPKQLLPPRGYTTADWFAREQEGLFGKVWNYAGFTGDLAAPGDYLCVAAGRAPLVVLRDETGELRAFHNICRHRGSQLLEGSGSVGRTIQCFYHNWTYDLRGRLRAVPQENEQFPGLDKKCLGLHPAKVATWKNLMFVHPDPEAEALEEWFAGFGETVGPHEPENLVEVSRARYRFKANWKIVVENFIDGYHLFYLHPQSLGDGDFFKQDWQPRGRHWTFRRPLKPGIHHDEEILPVIEGVASDYGAGAYILFPNLALFETATSWSTFFVIPVSADLSIVEVRVLAMPEALERLGNSRIDPTDLPEHILSVEGPILFDRLDGEGVHPLESEDVMREDIYACEAVQKGMNSPLFEVGPMSKYESALSFFQQQVLDYVPAE